MKSILLAAAAVIAMPAMAQDTPQATPPSAQPADQATPADTATPADPAATPADPAAPADAPADPGMTTQAPTTAPAPTTGDAATPPMGAPATGATAAPETSGGYAPSAAPATGPAQPGAAVRFEQPKSVAEAFPAPAPKESYPICKKGQYDGCLQASDARRSKRARR